MNWADWLSSMVGPLAKRVLSGLGIGWLTFESLGAMFNQARDAMVAAWGGIAGDVLVIADLAGAGAAIGIVLGALVARLAYSSLARLGKLLT